MNDKREKIELESDGNAFTGTEPFLAIYTQTQVILSGVRLTFDERIAHNVSDLGAQIETARRSFVHNGDKVKALQDVARIAASYRQRVQTWESQAQKREHGIAQQSGEKIAKMRAEHSRVRTKANLGDRALTKLEVEIHQLKTTTMVRATHAASVSDTTETTQDSSAAPEIETSPVPQFSEEELRLNTLLVNEALAPLLGPGLLISYDDASEPVDDENREQAWDSKQLLMVARWTERTRKIERTFDKVNMDDNARLAPQSPVKKRDLRIWLIPKSKKLSAAFPIAKDRIRLTLEGRDIDACELAFACDLIGDDFDEADLPSSMRLRKFLKRVVEKVANEEDDLNVLVADFKNLEPRQNQLLMKCVSS